MGEDQKKPTAEHTAVGSHERWVAGKSEEELLVDLKTHLALLKDDPRSLPDRLRVAALQLRLGRIDEALIHYQGVVGGYVAAGQIVSAIHLCQRLLAMYPDLKRVKQLLARLHARAPRAGEQAAPQPQEEPLRELPNSSFQLNELDLLGRPSTDGDGTDRFVLVDRLFPDTQKRNSGSREQRVDSQPVAPAGAEPEEHPSDLEEQTTERFHPQSVISGQEPLLLTHPKEPDGEDRGLDDDTEEDTTEERMDGQSNVVLLDRPKRSS